jgi:hypothetical protein
MNLRTAMDLMRAAWSDDHVCRVTRDFLDRCGWELEVGEGRTAVPADAEIFVSSAAVILSHAGFGDHVTVIVYLGVERSPPNLIIPLHGVLRLYLDDAGRMFTEDRYSPADWISRRT